VLDDNGIKNRCYTGLFHMRQMNLMVQREQVKSSLSGPDDSQKVIDSLFDRAADIQIKMAEEEHRRSAYLAEFCTKSTCVTEGGAGKSQKALLLIEEVDDEDCCCGPTSHIDFMQQSSTMQDEDELEGDVFAQELSYEDKSAMELSDEEDETTVSKRSS
jgi:hypothetical protein